MWTLCLFFRFSWSLLYGETARLWFFPTFGDSPKRYTIYSACPPRQRGEALPSRESLPRVHDVGADEVASAGRAVAEEYQAPWAATPLPVSGYAAPAAGWACLSRGARRKRWPRRSRCARPNI